MRKTNWDTCPVCHEKGTIRTKCMSSCACYGTFCRCTNGHGWWTDDNGVQHVGNHPKSGWNAEDAPAAPATGPEAVLAAVTAVAEAFADAGLTGVAATAKTMLAGVDVNELRLQHAQALAATEHVPAGIAVAPVVSAQHREALAGVAAHLSASPDPEIAAAAALLRDRIGAKGN